MSTRIKIAKKLGLTFVLLIVPGAFGLYSLRMIVKYVRSKIK